MANLLQYNNKSTIIDRLVLELFDKIYADYEAGLIKSETDFYYRLKESVKILYSTLYKPNFTYRAPGLTPSSQDYNQMMEEALLDFNYLLSDCQNLNQNLNQAFVEQEQRRKSMNSELKLVSQKIEKLKEKMNPTLMSDFLIETNSFISGNNASSNKMKAHINQEDGVLMLPFKQQIHYNNQVEVGILEGSNGIPGNTHVASLLGGSIYFDGETDSHLDLSEMLDDSEDTWFEYESFKVSDSVYESCNGFGFNYEEGLSWIMEEDGLTLRLQLTFQTPQYCNWLSLTPYIYDQKGIKASYLTRCYITDGSSEIQDITTPYFLNETLVISFQPQLVERVILEFDQQHYYEVEVGHQAYFKLNTLNFNSFNIINTDEARRYNGPLPSSQHLGLMYDPKTKKYSHPTATLKETNFKNEEESKKQLFSPQPDQEQAKSEIELINAFRYSIGIKKISLSYYEFEEIGEFISDTFTTDYPITKISLESNDYLPDGDASLIEYYLNFNDSDTWHPIVPVSRSYTGNCQYEINNGDLERYLRPNRNNQSQGVVTSFEDITKVRLKIILKRSISDNQQTPIVYDYRLKITTDGDYFDY